MNWPAGYQAVVYALQKKCAAETQYQTLLPAHPTTPNDYAKYHRANPSDSPHALDVAPRVNDGANPNNGYARKSDHHADNDPDFFVNVWHLLPRLPAATLPTGRSAKSFDAPHPYPRSNGS